MAVAPRFHQVTYAEADAMREAVYLAPSRPPLRFVRVFAEHIEKTSAHPPGPHCRECRQPVGARVKAIRFGFQPYATDEDSTAGHITDAAWLHLDPCPSGRV